MSGTFSKRGTLTKWQEELLGALVDRECRGISLFVARLIARRPAGKAYVAELTELRSKLLTTARGATSRGSDMPVDLWARIEQRIASEERAAIYLGSRSREGQQQGLATRVSDFWAGVWRAPAGSWGIPAGAVAILALVVTISSRPPSNQSSSSQVAHSSEQQAELAINVPPLRILRESAPVVDMAAYGGAPSRRLGGFNSEETSFDLDWVRSHGRVQVFPDEQGQGAVIWIRRPQGVNRRALGRAGGSNFDQSTAARPTSSPDYTPVSEEPLRILPGGADRIISLGR